MPEATRWPLIDLVAQANTSRRAATMVCAAFGIAKLATWQTTGPHPDAPLDIVTRALPEPIWIAMWMIGVAVALVATARPTLFRFGVSTIGGLAFLWGLAYIAASPVDPSYILSAAAHLALAGMTLVAIRLSSLIPMSREGAWDASS